MLLSRRDLPDDAAAVPLENVSLLSDAFMIFLFQAGLKEFDYDCVGVSCMFLWGGGFVEVVGSVGSQVSWKLEHFWFFFGPGDLAPTMW